MSNRTIHLAAVVLPAAGAYLATTATTGSGAAAYTPFEVKNVVTDILFELTYTPASATGRPKVYVALKTAAGVEMRSLVGSPPAFEEELLPLSPLGSGVAYVYAVPYKVDPGIIGARLVVGEYGDASNPGTVSAYASPGYGG